jgi:hypothetical protein
VRPSLAAVSLIMLTLTPSHCCWADSVFTDLGIVHGRITSLDANGLVIQLGCSSSAPIKWSWADVREVLFDKMCDSAPARLPSVGGSACATTPVQALIIYFRHSSRPVYAISAKLTGKGMLSFTTYPNSIVSNGPISDVRGIVSRLVCPSDVP